MFQRLAPPPDDLVAAHIEARTSPGDIVIDLHGRGGWIARSAIDRQRRAYTYEAGALGQLLAEIVLRPPDLRHLDATLNSLSAQGHGQIGLRQAIDQWYTSRCPGCGRQVVVDEFLWSTDEPAPLRKSYRCTVCRNRSGGGEQRDAPTDADDAERATALPADGRYREALRSRFPPLDAQPDLPDQLLALYTPRNLFALDALVRGVERELRAPSIQAALRLALVHTLLPASRLGSDPGRVAALPIRAGRVGTPAAGRWRERNPWRLFETGCRLVRAYSLRVSANADRAAQARFGDDLQALIDGHCNVVVRRGGPVAEDRAPSVRRNRPSDRDRRARVRLVLTEPPVRWTLEDLAFDYLATALVLGADAVAELPVDGLLRGMPRDDPGDDDAAALRRSLSAVRPILADDARAVLVLDETPRSRVAGGALAGVGAGYHLVDVVLSEVGDLVTGTLEFVLRGALPPGDPRLAPPPATTRKPFSISEVERAVTELAVEMLQARGEPAGLQRLLGEVLVGLDRRGHLRRLVGSRGGNGSNGPAQPRSDGDGDGGGDRHGGGRGRSRAPAGLFGDRPGAVRTAPRNGAQEEGDGAAAVMTTLVTASDGEPRAAGGDPPVPALVARPASDHEGLLLDLVLRELARADNPRLREIEPGQWWLREAGDVSSARSPLSDRLEWAVFSLLSTGGGLREPAFFDRVARMFRGHDAPDEELVRACLESYRDPLTRDELITLEDLPARAAEHGELVGRLAEYGRRLRMRRWIGGREQRRRYGDGVLADLLTDEERRVYLPLVASGDPDALRAVDCIWYVRGKATFLWEVESSAMIGETVLRRGRRIATDERLVRFLVIPPERAELLRLKLARSPVLRAAMDEDNWHVIKSDHLRLVTDRATADLDALRLIVGLDPEIEQRRGQLALFE